MYTSNLYWLRLDANDMITLIAILYISLQPMQVAVHVVINGNSRKISHAFIINPGGYLHINYSYLVG